MAAKKYAEEAGLSAPSSSHCYAAVLERAKSTVDQWDNHDQYRQTEADRSLNDPRIGEPDDVAIARTVLRLDDAIKLSECQHMGCGGNLKPTEIVESMRGILRDARSA